MDDKSIELPNGANMKPLATDKAEFPAFHGEVRATVSPISYAKLRADSQRDVQT